MWFSIVINQSKQFRYFSELALGYVHTTMPYCKVFISARKPYQIGSLLTHMNGERRSFWGRREGREIRKSAVYDGSEERERERSFPVPIIYRALTFTFYFKTKGCLYGEESVDTKSYPVCQLNLNQ